MLAAGNQRGSSPKPESKLIHKVFDFHRAAHKSLINEEIKNLAQAGKIGCLSQYKKGRLNQAKC
jgi:hypothetical protein